MIGVLARPEQRPVVEEFFELFKTPWEVYRPGTNYDVVLVSGDEIPPDIDTRLTVVFGSAPKDVDRRLGVVLSSWHRDTVTLAGKDSLPVYGGLQAFGKVQKQSAVLSIGNEVAAFRVDEPGRTIVRAGYDLFEEVRFLLTNGQPVRFAQSPTLELHIDLLRNWIADAGVSFFEIRPTPAGYDFITCLSHDIDFVGIRRHFFDHSMFGFVFRATVVALRNFLNGTMSARRLLRCWSAVASLPFVYIGWAKDFWEPFEWYLEVEKGLPATYFLIPFKQVPGERVPGKHAWRRASAYGVDEIQEPIQKLVSAGCEIGVHGLDSWHNINNGRAERKAIAEASGAPSIGVRMHWLLQDENTPAVLEDAGYTYDSTCGFNEAPGYRAGVAQVFRPFVAKTLLELPMHIQDGALFYPQRSNLTETEAFERCETMIANAKRFGGVLTLLWHDRSHAPERFWGDFYKTLVAKLKACDVWFGSAAQIVDWFRSRRQIVFEEKIATSGERRVRLSHSGVKPRHAFTVRVHRPSRGGAPDGPSFEDIPWNGESCSLPKLFDFSENAKINATHGLS